MAKLLITLGGFVVPGLAGYYGYPILWIFGWALVFSIVVASRAFRAFAGLPNAPDMRSAPMVGLLVRWVMSFVLMAIAYGVGLALRYVF